MAVRVNSNLVQNIIPTFNVRKSKDFVVLDSSYTGHTGVVDISNITGYGAHRLLPTHIDHEYQMTCRGVSINKLKTMSKITFANGDKLIIKPAAILSGAYNRGNGIWDLEFRWTTVVKHKDPAPKKKSDPIADDSAWDWDYETPYDEDHNYCPNCGEHLK